MVKNIRWILRKLWSLCQNRGVYYINGPDVLPSPLSVGT